MKSEIHPDYRYVIFNDLASGEKILTRTTANSDKTAEWTDGNTYPVTVSYTHLTLPTILRV